jgi:hypothetical protein
MGLNTFLIAFHTRKAIKPTQFIEDGAVANPTLESLAKYYSLLQSIRRALRSLHERDLVVKIYNDNDRRLYIWMARSGMAWLHWTTDKPHSLRRGLLCTNKTATRRPPRT